MHLSRRVQNTPPSPIRALAPLAAEAKAAGKLVHHLNIGQPDIAAPDQFFEGLHAYQNSIVGYDPSEGNHELREAWSNHINKANDLKTRPEEFIITTGASEALIFAFNACCDPGDEILTFEPMYANYMGLGTLAGVKFNTVMTKMDEGFATPGPEVLKASLNERTKALMLCNPSNPTGTHYKREVVAELLEFCRSHNLFFIVDETYRELVYDGHEPFSVFHLDGGMDRVIVIDSVSKRFSLCGARIGCVISKNSDIVSACWSMASTRLASPTLEQFAAAKMLKTLSDGYLDEIKSKYIARKDALLAACEAAEGISVHAPHGAFYTIARLSVDDVEEFAKFMLKSFEFENETVFIAPARGFYLDGEHARTKCRLAFVLEPERLERAVQILEKGIKAYSS